MTARRLRVLYLIEELDLGGAEQVVLHLARGLDRSRFEPEIACLSRRGRFAPAAEQAGIPVACLQKRPKLDWGLPGRIRRLARGRIDVMHSHLFTANLWSRVSGIGFGVPVVVTEHSVDSWKGPLHTALDRLLAPATSHWVFVSGQVRRFYERRLGRLRNASVIYNGVPLPDSPPAHGADGEVTLATVGRLSAEKEQIRFVELVDALHKERLPVRGLIIGDGPERASLQRAVSSRGLEGVVTLTGFVNGMERWWPQIDLFCLTSSREGLPLTALEAMGHGIPVISTEVGGVAECLSDEREGVLVPYGDWRALHRRTRALVTDSARRRSLGLAGRERVEREFAVARMVSAHEQLYERLARR